jgi:arginyl-tRNA synthetase
MEERLISAIKSIVLGQFATALDEGQIQLQKTRKEFEGDITLVVFPLTRISKLSPEETGKRLGEGLVATVEEVTAFNVVKGFLNITYSDSYWQDRLNAMRTRREFWPSSKRSP